MTFRRSALSLAVGLAVISSSSFAFTDIDLDGMPDGWEDAHTLIVSIDDSADDTLDSDGLTNIQEYLAGTNPLDPDTDKDGVQDGSDPWPTNSRYRADTDSDGLPDFFEYLNSSTFRTSPPYLDENNNADAAYDDDSDGLTNLQEFLAGTDFAVSDTDGDGIDDGADIAPLNPAWYSDTDSDGMPDEWEGDNGLNVGVDDSASNADTDGLTNLQEYLAGTDPQSDDTDLDGTNDDADIAPLDPVNSTDQDEDGMPDGWESANSLDDTDSLDAYTDSDSDGLSNLYEYLAGTGQNNPDTDNDGTLDGDDIWPLDRTRGLDDDRDGLPDNWETARGLSTVVANSHWDDADSDNLYDWQELEAGTDPTDADTDNDGVSDSLDPWPTNARYKVDTDNDGLPDWFENLNSPPLRSSPPYLDANYAADAASDDDTDSLSNLEEFLLGTDFANADTDGDGENDDTDVLPLDAGSFQDYDNDGMPDGWEYENGLSDGYAADASADPDSDGLTNLEEYLLGTDPAQMDTDGDSYDDAADRYPLDASEWEDINGDNIPDNWAYTYGGATSGSDGDSDAMTFFEEYLAGTDPTNPDTDNDGELDGDDIWPTNPDRTRDDDTDGLPDNWESPRGLSAASANDFWDDADSDGLFDWQELESGTDPTDADSDNDGVSDGDDPWPTDRRYRFDSDDDGLPDRFENLNSPVLKSSGPYLDAYYAFDAAYDDDSDNLTNLQEFLLGTDFGNPDTDGDGESDDLDVLPLDANSFQDYDNDGLPDGWEYDNGFDDYNALDAGQDSDYDGLSNLQEYMLGTDPWQDDTDGDGEYDGTDRYPLDILLRWDFGSNGIPDEWEDWNSIADAASDDDYDGLTALEEYLAGTSPYNPDTDFDGVMDGDDIWPTDNSRALDDDADDLPDGWEAAHGLSTAVTASLFDDTDSDGLMDWQEYEAGTHPDEVDSDFDGVNDNLDPWPRNSLYSADSDSDGLPDLFEDANAFGVKGAPPYLDASYAPDGAYDDDNDGLSNLEEFLLGTDFGDPDSDGDGTDDGIDAYPLDPASSFDADNDGLPNGWELANGLYDSDYLDATYDYDSDGLTNLQEYLLGTDISLMDTDNDGYDDGADRYPLDPDEYEDFDRDGLPGGWELLYSLSSGNAADADADNDYDGLSNLQEYMLGTDPSLADTDSDTLSDDDEVRIHRTSPLLADTDSDGMSDSWELSNSLDPLTNDATGDPDSDGLDNAGEFAAGTDPNDPDSDSDGVNDGADAFPTDPGETLDTDSDGTGNNADLDDDGDGFSDADELLCGSDPLDAGDFCALASAGESDFDADADDDVLLRNNSSFAWRLFSIQNGAVVSNAAYGAYVNGGWAHVANIDVDGDYDKDVLLRNTSTGAWRIFYTQNGAVVSDANFALYAASGYSFQAALDVDADGDEDVLLRNSSDGKWKLFTVQAGSVVANSGFNLWSDSGYQLAAAGDFDGDMDDDVLLRGVSDGKYRLFTVESGAVTGFSGIGQIYASADFQLQVAQDMDADGDEDILIRNTATGQWRYYTMQANSVLSSGGFYPYQSTAYQFQAGVDVDADGDADILLRNTSSGIWRLFTVEAGAVTGNSTIGLYSSTAWDLAH